MSRQLKPPLEPMEALSVSEPPSGSNWQYEPKWDGFRCLAFRNGSQVFLQSKSGQPLARYFPDLVAALRKVSATQFVLDGEIVIPARGRLSFDELLLRIHPAASRVKKLAGEHPAVLIVFDLLADEVEHSLLRTPLELRRTRLERFAKRQFQGITAIRLSPATKDLSQAKRRFNARGANLDGIVAKRTDLDYRAGERDGMQKIKHQRTADCVVGGFRYSDGKKLVGSLLLGLYDHAGVLNHVGFTSAFSAADRKKITAIVKPFIGGAGFSGRAPGGPSRWSTRQSSEWQPLRPTLVIEVAYDHFTNGRFRHGTQFIRWRPDKAASKCSIDQIDQKAGSTLKLLGLSATPQQKRTRSTRNKMARGARKNA